VQPQSTPLSAGTTTCNGTYSGRGTDVVVPAGAVCRLLPGTTVSHTITVRTGGTLNAQGVTVGADVVLTGPLPSSLCATTIAHDVTVSNAGASATPIVIGDTANGCSASNRIGHDIVISGNAGPVTVSGNQVGHDVVVKGNQGRMTVSANQVTHDVVVSSNTGAVTVSANRAGNDLVVQGNKPGGATIVGNTATHNATCSGNSPQTGSGNTAGGIRTCPA
jgi:hypothetical protein